MKVPNEVAELAVPLAEAAVRGVEALASRASKLTGQLLYADTVEHLPVARTKVGDIPKLDKSGYLPTGAHEASQDEFARAFATTDHRKNLNEGMGPVVDMVAKSWIADDPPHVYARGSYVSGFRPRDLNLAVRPDAVDMVRLREFDPVVAGRSSIPQVRKYGVSLQQPQSIADLREDRWLGRDVGFVKVNIEPSAGTPKPLANDWFEQKVNGPMIEALAKARQASASGDVEAAKLQFSEWIKLSEEVLSPKSGTRSLSSMESMDMMDRYSIQRDFLAKIGDGAGAGLVDSKIDALNQAVENSMRWGIPSRRAIIPKAILRTMPRDVKPFKS